jgi:uncharacterized protein
VQPPDSRASGGVTPFGWAFFAALLWGFAVGVVRARYAWKWPVTVGVLAAVPVVAAVVLKDPGTAAILLSFPAPLAFALGFGCGRSRTVRWVTGGFVLVIGLLVGIAIAVGADSFGLGLLYAMGGGIGCLLLTLIAMGMRMAWKRSLLEFGVRSALVAAIVAYVAFQNPPDLLWTDWESWLPTGAGRAGDAVRFLPGQRWHQQRARAAALQQQFQFQLQFQQPEFVGRLQQRRWCVRQLVEKRALAASGAAAVLK